MARKQIDLEQPEVIDDQEVEVLEQETGGAGLDLGLVFATTFLLLAAVVMIALVLKRDYDAGPLA